MYDSPFCTIPVGQKRTNLITMKIIKYQNNKKVEFELGLNEAVFKFLRKSVEG
jgi:hypothetical protein